MLGQSLIVFEDLNDLQRTLDEYVDLYKDALQRYGDRLGNLLRLSGGTSEQVSGGSPQQTQTKDGSQKRKGSDKEPWTIFKLDKEGDVNLRIANIAVLSPTSAENALLFRMIESLKEKLENLKDARKIISELPTLGYRTNQRFLVAFADGLPKQIIPTNQSYSTSGRFQFMEEFEVGLLDEAQELIEP